MIFLTTESGDFLITEDERFLILNKIILGIKGKFTVVARTTKFEVLPRLTEFTLVARTDEFEVLPRITKFTVLPRKIKFKGT